MDTEQINNRNPEIYSFIDDNKFKELYPFIFDNEEIQLMNETASQHKDNIENISSLQQVIPEKSLTQEMQVRESAQAEREVIQAPIAEFTSSTASQYSVNSDGTNIIFVNGITGKENEYIPNLAVFRYIDGIHDFNNKIENIKEILSADHIINNLELKYSDGNSRNSIIQTATNDSSPQTLHKLINLSELKEEKTVILTNDNEECFNIKVPKIYPMINFEKLMTEPYYKSLVTDTLKSEKDIIIRINGKDTDYYDDVTKEESLLKNIIGENSTAYSKDAINLTDDFFKQLYNNKPGYYYLAGLIDPAPGKKSQLKLNDKKVVYKLLYTHIKKEPVYCAFTNFTKNEHKPNSYTIQFYYKNYESLVLEVNTTDQHLSPSIEDIALYINTPNKFELATINNISRTVNNVVNIYKDKINFITTKGETTRKTDWTSFFDILIYIFTNLFNKHEEIELNSNNIINLLVSFKTIGDQMYFYDGLALKSEYPNTSVVSGDGFLIDYIINTQQLSTINSTVSGPTKKKTRESASSGSSSSEESSTFKTIEYYKSPNNTTTELNEQTRDELNSNIKNKIKDINKNFTNDILPKVDKIIGNIYNILTSIHFIENIDTTSRKQIELYKYTIKLNENEPHDVTSLFCSYFYYSSAKFYAMYLILLVEILKMKDIINKDINQYKQTDLLALSNILYIIEDFDSKITNINFENINSIISTFFILIDNQECFNMIEVGQEYNEKTINTINIINNLITEEMQNIYQSIKIPTFIYNNYLKSVCDINYSKSIVINNDRLTQMFNKYVLVYGEKVIKLLNNFKQDGGSGTPDITDVYLQSQPDFESNDGSQGYIGDNESNDGSQGYIGDNESNDGSHGYIGDNESIDNESINDESINDSQGYIGDNESIDDSQNSLEDNKSIDDSKLQKAKPIEQADIDKIKDDLDFILSDINNIYNTTNTFDKIGYLVYLNNSIELINDLNEFISSSKKYQEDNISLNKIDINSCIEKYTGLLNDIVEQLNPYTDKVIININNGYITTDIINYQEQNNLLLDLLLLQKPAEVSLQKPAEVSLQKPAEVSLQQDNNFFQVTDLSSMSGSNSGSDLDFNSDIESVPNIINNTDSSIIRTIGSKNKLNGSPQTITIPYSSQKKLKLTDNNDNDIDIDNDNDKINKNLFPSPKKGGTKKIKKIKNAKKYLTKRKVNKKQVKKTIKKNNKKIAKKIRNSRKKH